MIQSPARPFNHGFEVSFEQATVYFEFAAFADDHISTIPVTVLHNDGRIEQPSGGGDPIDAFVRQLDAAAEWFHDGTAVPALDAQIAIDALQICEMQR